MTIFFFFSAVKRQWFDGSRMERFTNYIVSCYSGGSPNHSSCRHTMQPVVSIPVIFFAVILWHTYIHWIFQIDFDYVNRFAMISNDLILFHINCDSFHVSIYEFKRIQMFHIFRTFVVVAPKRKNVRTASCNDAVFIF